MHIYARSSKIVFGRAVVKWENGVRNEGVARPEEKGNWTRGDGSALSKSVCSKILSL